jgi:hypothetical protein
MRRLSTPRWLLVHAGVVILVIAFLALGYWQLGRAANGNLLSFGYAVEWPAFAAFVIYVWVKEMRKALRSDAVASTDTIARPAAPPRRARTGAAYDDSGDEELAAYNRYLAWLNAHPHASASEYPGEAS